MKEQALDIIQQSRLIYLATNGEDGAPRSTILLGFVSDDGEITWRSSPEAIHSQNIARNGKVGISAYFEDDTAQVFRAVHISSSARDNGNEKINEEERNITHEYVASIGEYDEVQSKLNRLYFKEHAL